MFLHGIEFIARERYKDLLKEAEQIRLIKSLRYRRERRREIFAGLAYWLGTQMVKWGAKLQGHHPRRPAQMAAAAGVGPRYGRR